MNKNVIMHLCWEATHFQPMRFEFGLLKQFNVVYRNIMSRQRMELTAQHCTGGLKDLTKADTKA